MKKFSFIIALLLALISPGFSQGCLPDGILFSSQAAIDNFQTNYPDCTEIQGNVAIDGEDITNLNGLNGIISIGGQLRIENNPLLIDLTGLENLTSIWMIICFS
jgi:hypothetical protein